MQRACSLFIVLASIAVTSSARSSSKAGVPAVALLPIKSAVSASRALPTESDLATALLSKLTALLSKFSITGSRRHDAAECPSDDPFICLIQHIEALHNATVKEKSTAIDAKCNVVESSRNQVNATITKLELLLEHHPRSCACAANLSTSDKKFYFDRAIGNLEDAFNEKLNKRNDFNGAAEIFAEKCAVTLNGGDPMTTRGKVAEFLNYLRNDAGALNFNLTATSPTSQDYADSTSEDKWTSDSLCGVCSSTWACQNGVWVIVKDDILYTPCPFNRSAVVYE